MKKLKFLCILTTVFVLASVFSITALCETDKSITLPNGVHFTKTPTVAEDGDFGKAWNVLNNVAELNVNMAAGTVYQLKYDVRAASGGTGILIWSSDWSIPFPAFTWEASWEFKYPNGTSTKQFPDFMSNYVTVDYIFNTTDGSSKLTIKSASGMVIYSGESPENSAFKLPKYIQIRSFNATAPGIYLKNVIFEEYIPEMIESVNVDGIFEIGQTLTGTFAPFSEYADSECTFRWLASDSIDGDYEPLLNETANTLTISEEYAEKFIKFEVTPVSNGIKGKTVLSAPLERTFKPTAIDVHIVGQKTVGNVLEGRYTFYDKNEGDREDTDGTVFSWYKYDSESEDFKVIENETARFYTVKEGDTQIKFGVQPKSDHEPYFGEVYFSEPVTDPKAPVASEVKITGNTAVGAELMGSYAFYDENNDKETDSIFTWYRLNSIVDTSPIAVGTGEKYTVSEADIGKYLVFGVKPMADAQPFEGLEVKSEPFICPCTPVAKNVKISGQAYSGKMISGTYDYVHNLDIGEGESKFSWLIASSKSGNYTEIGTDSTLMLKDSYVGKYIKFSVTPIASAEPIIGETVESEPIHVKSRSASSGGSGGGGGGGITISPSKSNGNDENENKNTTGISAKMNFKDISGHWAYSDIEWAFKNGIVKGVSDEAFEPEKALSEAELIAMLVRSAGIKVSESDSRNTSWYNVYLEAAKKNNITQDMEITDPNGAVSRAKMARLLVNTYEFMTGKDLTINENIAVNDAELMSTQELTAVKKAISAGLLNGVGNNYYSPAEKTTRAQSAAVIKRLLNAK